MVRASLRPSATLCALFIVAHVAAAATLIPLDVALEWKLALVAAVVVSLIRSLLHHAFRRGADAIVEVQVDDKERGSIRTRTGVWLDARILGTTCVTPALTAIDLRVDGMRTPRHVLLVRDNVDAGDFRKIRVLLRWARRRDDVTADAEDARG
jgi:toxin CptA